MGTKNNSDRKEPEPNNEIVLINRANLSKSQFAVIKKQLEKVLNKPN